MRLAQRLLLGSLAVITVLIAVIAVIVDVRLRSRITEEAALELARAARLVDVQWRGGGEPDSLADAAGEALGHRVTLIDTAGVVVGDSEFDGLALARLENHASRPEVAQARRQGTGSARRVSPSAGDEELYVAVRGQRGIARVSLGTRTLETIFDRAERDIAIAGFIALALALALSFLFSRAVSRPIVMLRDVAQSMASGKLGRRPALSAPGEVGDLSRALDEMASQLGARLDALEAEDALLSALTDSLNEGVLAVDARGTVVRLNDTARQLLSVRDAPPFPADRLPREPVLRDALGGALRGSATDSVETTIGGRTVALTARPLMDGGAVLAVLDLTPLRRLETVRRDFVANVSHELRTPLTVVGGFAETLLDDDLPPEQRRQFSEAILANARRMQRIVDDLLDLSRIESGGWVPKPAPVDVGALAADVLQPHRAAAATKGIALHVRVAPGASQAWADPTALRQVLSNLVDNAIRHTASGSVTVSAHPEAGGVRLAVEDTGSGIPAEHLPRIFERFYRADPARSREAGGTGLGLAIVRHLVEAHGGRVAASSTVGRGTTITASIPGRGAS